MQVEAELTELPSEERVEYLNSLGVSESGLGNLIRETYNLLGLRTYFTSGEKVNVDVYIYYDVNIVMIFCEKGLISFSFDYLFHSGDEGMDNT